VQIASRFRCDVSLVSGVRRASARSIIAVMLLSAAVGTTLRVETDGPDELAAMTAIVSLLSDGIEQR
jgi:phosphocarrier protein HPr